MFDVTYEMASTAAGINQKLQSLETYDLLSLDTECCGIFSRDDRKYCEEHKEDTELSPKERNEHFLIANNSGLSYPSLTHTTHFIFGLSETHSVILVCFSDAQASAVWRWVAKQECMFIIHNASFDLLHMYQAIHKLPKKYEDSSLLAKCLMNNTVVYKARVGLKLLVGHMYKPAWSLFDEYEPEDLLKPAFLEYCAIDGAAVIYLWNNLAEFCHKES